MNWQMPTANSLEPYWMPFTANRAFKAHPRMIARAEGMYYYTDRGDALLDGSSGLFCVGAGHGRKQIAEITVTAGGGRRKHDYVALSHLLHRDMEHPVVTRRTADRDGRSGDLRAGINRAHIT